MQILRMPNTENGETYKETSRALHMGKFAAKRAICGGEELIGYNPINYLPLEMKQLSVIFKVR